MSVTASAQFDRMFDKYSFYEENDETKFNSYEGD